MELWGGQDAMLEGRSLFLQHKPHGHHVLAQAGACPGVGHPTRRFGAAHLLHGLSLMRVAGTCSLPSAEDLVVEEAGVA